jgi:hypothetical protein
VQGEFEIFVRMQVLSALASRNAAATMVPSYKNLNTNEIVGHQQQNSTSKYSEGHDSKMIRLKPGAESNADEGDHLSRIAR